MRQTGGLPVMSVSVRAACFAAACCAALSSCGGRSSDHKDGRPDATAGTTGTAGTANSDSDAGIPASAGSLGTAGADAAANGGAGSSGASSGSVNICLYPDEVPESWGAGGAPDASNATCVEGNVGPFTFDNCRYQLLDGTPRDVDPFSSGHSHCCYRSKLLGCD